MKIYSKDHVYEYAPDYMDNRKLPANEMIVFGLKVLPQPEFEKYQSFVMLNSQKFSKDKAAELSEKKFKEILKSKYLFSRHLIIEGVVPDAPDGGYTFDTVFEHCPDIAKDIMSACLSTAVLTAGEQKNFVPEPDLALSAPADPVSMTATPATNQPEIGETATTGTSTCIAS